MSTEESASGSPSAGADPKPAPPKKPAPPPARELPDLDGIARWIQGEEYPLVGVLFENLPLKRYDGLVMQIKKGELLPQHWQVISSHQVPDGIRFEDLYAVGKLRLQYRDTELTDRRLGALETAWEELRGKSPSLWNASDVFAAIRRIIQKNREVEFYDLLTAVRDVWRNLSLPHGKEQLEVLWACLEFVRGKTRK
ncbi:MAG: hypothetical protein ACE5GX_02005 [Thermoanaerobaculia bacterium]